MINSYFTTSVIPSAYTCAIEKNQKPALDNDMLHNYRPVSNLPFVSKLRDRVVAKQLNAHLYESEIHTLSIQLKPLEIAPIRVKNDIFATLETELFCVKNDIAAALDTQMHNDTCVARIAIIIIYPRLHN